MNSNNNTLADETLMAFADGELDATQQAQVELALQSNPLLRQRVEQMQQQRARIGAAFGGMLDTPVPDRLTQLLQAPLASPNPVVTDLAVARAARAERAHWRPLPTWAHWGGMAASVVLGVLLGARFLGTGLDPAMGLNQGQLVAGGVIDSALTGQLASEPAAANGVAVQLSFVDTSGNYCRTFSTTAVAGLACRQTEHWVVQQVVALDTATIGTVRPAATTLPAALLAEVDKRVAAQGTLDAAAERQARAQAWRK